MRTNNKIKKIRLVYWNEPNFGDMLSPFIISKLSGKEILYKRAYCGIKHNIKLLLKLIWALKFDETKHIHFSWEKNLLGIGSIISWGNRHSIIWGSGFMNENEVFRGGKILAVRGKYTNNKLIKDGFSGTSIWGDPALLIPLFISPSSEKTKDIAIIPHWSEYDYFIKKYGEKYKVIDLRTKDIEHVISEITSSCRILSTSLHGIIVSHAYGIPALWIRHEKLHGSNFKFYDYFSSVGIKEYEGFTNIDEILQSQQTCISCFDLNKNRALPNVNIEMIQKKILSVSPFLYNLYLK